MKKKEPVKSYPIVLDAYEIRVNDDMTLDEVVADKPLHLHLEQMSERSWWMGIQTKDGRHITVNFESNGNIRTHAEVDG